MNLTEPLSPPPPLTHLTQLDRQLQSAGFAVLDAADTATLAGWQEAPATVARRWQGFWQRLPADAHLRDGGRYRFRRHGCGVAEGLRWHWVPHRAHWQPVAYNALHGGFERWFDPLEADWAHDPTVSRLILALAERAQTLRGGPAEPWFVEGPAFRIDASQGLGRPTPEGAHRDGVDLVAVLMLDRHAIKGGETRVFDARGPQGMRFTLDSSLSVLLLDDERVIHETTPIQALAAGEPAWRDTLVLTFRRGRFQGPDSP